MWDSAHLTEAACCDDRKGAELYRSPAFTFTLFCLWKTCLPLPTKCEKENCFACTEHSIFRDSLRRSWQPWAGFMGELCLPAYILHPKLMNPMVHVNMSGLSTQWNSCFPPGGGRHWGPGKLLQCTGGLNTMQRMLLLGKEISFRASISYLHIRDMVLSLYLSQILVGVIKQRSDMKLLN